MYNEKFWTVVLVAVFSVATGIAQSHRVVAEDGPLSESILAEIQEVDRLFVSGGGTQPLTFETAAAIDAGYSALALGIVADLVRFTNALLEDARTEHGNAGLKKYAVRQLRRADLKQDFPLVDRLFGYASQRAAEGTPITDRISSKSASREAWYDNAYTVCGSFATPQPWSAAPRMPIYVTGDRLQWLTTNGYHQTPTQYFGGGWTRPRSYRPEYCLWNSFRDHAWLDGMDSRLVWEQNYRYYVPNGEPNPEIYTYLWPYSTWPAYVYWWHQTH